MGKELLHQTIHEIAPKLKNREISAHELARLQMERIEKLDSKLGTYLHICREQALARAQVIDEQIAKGNYTSSLMGIPLGPKDIYLTEGIPTTCASKILEGYVPPYNSTVIQKLLESGMVIVGKINMDEFAMGSSNENSAYKQVKNPWNLDCVP